MAHHHARRLPDTTGRAIYLRASQVLLATVQMVGGFPVGAGTANVIAFAAIVACVQIFPVNTTLQLELTFAGVQLVALLLYCRTLRNRVLGSTGRTTHETREEAVDERLESRQRSANNADIAFDSRPDSCTIVVVYNFIRPRIQLGERTLLTRWIGRVLCYFQGIESYHARDNDKTTNGED